MNGADPVNLMEEGAQNPVVRAQMLRMAEACGAAMDDVVTSAHRSSYPMGNARHGTDESPDWGPFCVECVQSWPCEMSAAGSRLRAMVRLLVDSGDMTPMGARQVGLVLDEMTEDA